MHRGILDVKRLPLRWAFFFFILVLSLSGAPNVFAQEETPPDDGEIPAWDNIVSVPYSLGDRSFNIGLGLLFPTFFLGDIEDNQHGLRLGGTGSLSFNYFLSPNIFIGGELSGSFSGSRAGNMLYMVPLGARVGYQFLFYRFEIPVSLMIGGVFHRYLERGFFGIIAKPSAAVYWRFNMDWSFGVNAAWWFTPQWPKNGHNVYGNFAELTVSARYHF